ncbi:hypothetical protein AXF42_Ash015436 [Apostasia shenzhenica]|uniref:Uncharacterized protein n=1 Tax=Apostasia shenzhenica TaxID=1088818 RepID=A0A2H9ZS74_9ASPA|nr:hypothetical protein AXF42_Ash015436 [Apostasia shenzhenica]
MITERGRRRAVSSQLCDAIRSLDSLSISALRSSLLHYFEKLYMSGVVVGDDRRCYSFSSSGYQRTEVTVCE